MNYKLLYFLTILLILPACSQQNNLTPIGKAYQSTSFEAEDLLNQICKKSCNPIIDSSENITIRNFFKDQKNVKFSIDLQADAVYQDLFFVNKNENSLMKLSIDGDIHPDVDSDQNAIYLKAKSRISKSFEIPIENFFEGENIILTFYCNQEGENYDCNQGKWIPLKFDLPNFNEKPCEKNEYKGLFSIISFEDSELTEERISKVEKFKSEFEDEFHAATSNLATIDNSHPIVTITDKNLVQESFAGMKNYLNTREFTKRIFETYEDEFDFIYVFTTYETQRSQDHTNVVNYIEGIGRDIYDSSTSYGSKGTLLGVNHMGFIDMYDENKYFVHNGLLHETGHQWCCFIGDNFAKGKDNPNLEIIQGFIHFYRGLESPHDTGTPMKSDFWVDKGNGIYSRQNQQRVKKYHPFELYFMGLLTKDNFDFNKKFNLYDAGIVGKDFNDQTAVPYKKVSIQDIINVEGIRKCNTPATSSILALKKSTPLEPIK